MVHEDLFARLNEAGYKNWLKAGYCLLKVKDGLCGYADGEVRRFHCAVISNNSVLRRGRRCRSSCRPRGNKFDVSCPLCNEWKTEILRHHTKPSCIINWGNCRPWLWPTEHWEVAKAFMPRGLADLYRADQCDAAALLNLLHLCDHFRFINPNLITEVIRCRNELMHSCEMQVSDDWMKHFQKSLEQLLLTLRHVPEVAAAGQQIRERYNIHWNCETQTLSKHDDTPVPEAPELHEDMILSVDLSLHIPGVDSVDGATVEGVLIESISRCEKELLRESMQDLLNRELDVIPLEKLQNFHKFLSSHKDLEEQFSTELQSLQLLEAQLLQTPNTEHLKR